MTKMKVLATLITITSKVQEIVDAEANDPMIFTGPEKQVLARCMNELDDDLETLAENWGLLPPGVTRSTPWQQLDDPDFDDDLFDDHLLEDQEMADFAQDRDEYNIPGDERW